MVSEVGFKRIKASESKLEASIIIVNLKLHYLQMSNNQKTDGQIQSTTLPYL